MPKLIDMTGQRFGRLTVIERHGTKGGHAAWLCECTCGNTVIVDGKFLRMGATQSCGCYRKECAAERHTTHGRSKSRLYNIYHNMLKRCFKSNNHKYKDYGGRGITVCDEWKDSFQAFYDWAMANGYSDELTLDRKNNDSNYEPSNCRWATQKEQANNRRKRKRGYKRNGTK